MGSHQPPILISVQYSTPDELTFLERKTQRRQGILDFELAAWVEMKREITWFSFQSWQYKERPTNMYSNQTKLVYKLQHRSRLPHIGPPSNGSQQLQPNGYLNSLKLKILCVYLSQVIHYGNTCWCDHSVSTYSSHGQYVFMKPLKSCYTKLSSLNHATIQCDVQIKAPVI